MTYPQCGFASTRHELLANRLAWCRKQRLRALAASILTGLWSLSAGNACGAPFEERAPATLQDAGLTELIEHAIAESPDMHLALARYHAAIEQVPQETSWPNPDLTLKYFVQELETRVGPQTYALGVSQTLPWRKRLRLAGEAASHLASAAAADIQASGSQLVREVTEHWIELAWLVRSIELVEANQVLMASLEAVVRTRYSTGLAMHRDLVQAQMELDRISARSASLKDRLQPVRSALNALLNRRADAELPVPEALELTSPQETGDALFTQLLRHNPKLQRLRHELAAIRANLEHTHTNRLPDIAVGLEYIVLDKPAMQGMHTSTRDPISLSLRVNLPLARTALRAEARQVQAMVEATEARRGAAVNLLRAQLDARLFELRDAMRDVELIRTRLLPRNDTSLAALLPAYSSGAADFADLIDTWHQQLELELRKARAVADHNLALARVEELLGTAPDMTALTEAP